MEAAALRTALKGCPDFAGCKTRTDTEYYCEAHQLLLVRALCVWTMSI